MESDKRRISSCSDDSDVETVTKKARNSKNSTGKSKIKATVGSSVSEVVEEFHKNHFMKPKGGNASCWKYIGYIYSNSTGKQVFPDRLFCIKCFDTATAQKGVQFLG